MDTLRIIFQLVVGLGLLNVWLLRPHLKTPYRGCNANNLKEEFKAYGFPIWFFYFIGALKVGSALLLLVGLWIPTLVFPSSLLIAILMMGALAMHIRVGDPWKKSMPALTMFLLSVFICLASM
jgi:uncharacterized membrane protein YkgB